jgi:multidrug efflux system outer membrane protein
VALNILLAHNPGPIEGGVSLQAITVRDFPTLPCHRSCCEARPDIASAELQVAAADARLSAARAQTLPSVRLSAALGSVA